MGLLLVGWLPARGQSCIQDATIEVFGGGTTALEFCTDDDRPDMVRFTTSTLAMPFAYVVVDADDKIVYIDHSNFLDFEELPIGNLRIFAFSHMGLITGQVGQDFTSTPLAAICFGLTTNFIEVGNILPEGGRIATDEGETDVFVCAEDGVPDLIDFEAEAEAGHYAYLITDTDNLILEISADEDIDFEGPGPEVVRVWGLAYGGQLFAEAGMNAATESLAECFDLSDNFVTITRGEAVGGAVSAPGQPELIYVCPGDGNADAITFASAGAGGPPNYGYLVTDENNGIIYASASNTIDFDALGTGTARVWGIAYAGALTAAPGAEAGVDAMASGCFDLSDNFVTVIREVPDGGRVQTTDGIIKLFVCPDDQPDILFFDSLKTSNTPYVYLVTNRFNDVVAIVDGDSFDFNTIITSDSDRSRVYGVAYTGNLTVQLGEKVRQHALSDDCYDISENVITVYQQAPEGGTVATIEGDSALFVCPDDGLTDVIVFDTADVNQTPYVFLLTDENNVILSVHGNSIDFEDLDEGTVRVWGLSYTGTLTAEAGANAAEAALSDDCFDLSDNFVTVTLGEPDAGLISTTTGEELLYICPGDGNPNVIHFDSTGGFGPAAGYRYVITDENNLILAVTAADSFDFDPLGAGATRVWGLVFVGELTAQVGANSAETELATGCFDLSDNFITVIREVPDAGRVQTPEGLTTVYVCPGDDTPDIVHFDSLFTGSTPYVYMITNRSNDVLIITQVDSFDFNTFGTEITRVYGVAYTGNLTIQIGQKIGQTVLSDDCYEISESIITVFQEVPEGGTIELENGDSTRFFCPDDGQPDVVSFDTSGVGVVPYVFLVTDENNNIVTGPVGSTIDFEGYGNGTFRVWGLAYTGTLNLQPGANVEAALSSDCFDLTDNFITITKGDPDAGTVSTADGKDLIYVCPGDGNPNLIFFDNTGTFGADTYRYLITDENNVILAIADGDSFDFEVFGPGTTRVWGLIHAGDLNAQVGDNAAELTGDCFDLSDNFITVISEAPEAGRVQTAGEGLTTVYVCPGNGTPDVIHFDSLFTGSTPYVYVITNRSNDVLIITQVDSFDFNSFGSEITRVYGVAYTGNLTLQVGQKIGMVPLSDDCYDISESIITVFQEAPEGGTIALPNGDTNLFLCPDSEQSDVVTFDTAGVGVVPYVFLVTDENNVILAGPLGNTIDFSTFGEGSFRVWGLAYTGTLNVQAGDNAAEVLLSDDCFDLTDNFVTVKRGQPDGGTVSAEDGTTDVLVCTGDLQSDVIHFDSAGTSNTAYTYVITDENNIIIALPAGDSADFNNDGPAIQRVWGLAYTGTLTAELGDDAATSVLSDACFSLSDNFITITREAADGGTVTTQAGETLVYTCPGDGSSDRIQFDSAGTSGQQYAYIVTDTNNVILALSPTDRIDFNNLGTGIARVWGLAYNGLVTAQVGLDADEIPLASGCYSLSENFVTVVREVPVAGAIATEDGTTDVLVCPDDVPDVVRFDSIGASNSPYAYIITNENNLILQVVTGDAVDFNNFITGIAHVWGVAYTGTLSAPLGGNITAIDLSDDCFDLSDNFIRVVRETPRGGRVVIEGGATEAFICPGDGLSDVIGFDSLNASPTKFSYVVTDENNIIQSLPAGDAVDFDTLGEGVSRVWGLAYTGTLTAQIGENAGTTALSDECFDLSDNFVTITRGEALGGTVARVGGGSPAFVCPGDGLADLITLSSSGAQGPAFTYVVTDTNNVVLTIPAGNVVDFDTLGEGVARIWGLSYGGQLTIQPGDDADETALAEGCADLSDNFITVIREIPDGGTVTTAAGDTVLVCGGNGVPDVVNFETNFDGLINYVFLIVQDSFLLTELTEPFFNFENTLPGNYQVFGLAYTGTLQGIPGDNIFEVALSTGCFDLSDNFIQIEITRVDGGQISTSTDREIVYVCPNDGEDDVVTFVNTSGAPENNYAYLITTDNNIVLAIIGDDSFNFDNTGIQELRVWGVSYTGELTVEIGSIVDAVPLSDGCYELSQNFVAIFNDEPDGGSVSANGETDVLLCIGNDDGLLEVQTTSTSLAGYVLLVTDTNNVVINVTEGQTADFRLLAPGDYRIRGLSYTGELLVEAGDDAAAAELATSCYELSDNFISVERSETLTGGTISTVDGATTVYTCPGDEMGDIVVLETTSQDLNYRYILTDTFNRILVPDIEGNIIDFDAAAPGVCRIWGVSVIGDFLAAFGQEITTDALTDYCWDLSDNFITVVRRAPNGGMVSTTAGETSVTLNLNDDGPKVVELQNTGALQTPYVYLVTDEANTILAISQDNSIDFNNSTTGVNRIWGLSFTGDLTAVIGLGADTLALSDDCFDLSDNFVTVTLAASLTGNAEAPGAIASVRIELWPNPAVDFVRIHLEQANIGGDTGVLELYDNQGRLVRTQRVEARNGETTFEYPISELRDGVYLLRYRVAEKMTTIRFVKQ